LIRMMTGVTELTVNSDSEIEIKILTEMGVLL